MRTGISCRAGLLAVCTGTLLAVPAGALALTIGSGAHTPVLSVHSVTTNIPNSAFQMVATARCGHGETVVSGGYSTTNTGEPGGAVSSRAVRGGWSVRFIKASSDMLTVYAYCVRGHQISLSTHEKTVQVTHAESNTTATAKCASGETLVSGGYQFVSKPITQLNSPVFRDYSASGRKWTVMAAFSNAPAKLAAIAYCEKSGVVKVRSHSSAPTPGGHTGAAKASCRKGETLLAGGYTTTPRPDWHATQGPDLVYSGSYRYGTRSWRASARNFSSESSLTRAVITAFAYCMP